MAFKPGQSGNPAGRSKESWLAEKEKTAEARKTWQKLLAIRDGQVLERKVLNTPDGPFEVDVVPSVRDLIKVCEVILDRAVGKPNVAIDLTSKGRQIINHTYTIDANKEFYAEQERRRKAEKS